VLLYKELDMVPPSKIPTEVELKFLLLPKESLAIARNPLLAGETTQTDLSSVYYDTPDWALHKQGITLRVRRVNGAFLQTVKSEVGANLFDRGEWECEISGGEPDRSAFAGTPAEDVLCEKAADTLIRLFSTEVRRTKWIVEEGSDLIEVSLDHGSIVAGSHRKLIDELELELKGGEADGLFAIAHRFAGDAVLKLSFESKAERGYRLVAGEASVAQNAGVAHIRGDITGAQAFALVMRSCLAQVCDNAHLLREMRNAEALHQLRVGLRRLRAAFATFKPILPGKELSKIGAEIGWMGGELDKARDLDVFIANTIHSGKDESEEDSRSRALDDRLSAAQTASYDRALAAVDSNRFAMLVLNCSEWVEIGSWRRSRNKEVVAMRDGAASALACAALDRLSRKLRKAGKHMAALAPPARHCARIRAKKLRYAAEFFAEAFGRHSKGRRSKFIASLARLQDILGDLNDLAVGDQTLLEAAGENATLAFRARSGVDEHDRDEAHILQKAVRAYKDWRRAKAFWR
jgi:triphosphatase